MKIEMTAGKILPLLIRFSVPLILSSFLQLFFNAADMVIVSKWGDQNAMGAVGSTSSLVNLLVNFFLGLSVGCNVVAATYLGAGKKTEVNQTVHTGLVLSLICGIILTLTGVLFTKNILQIMGTPDEILSLSSLYLKIYFGGITATVVYNFGASLLRAKGDTRRPLVILLAAGVINVLLNVVFVLNFPKEFAVCAVALATVISQLFCAICVVILLIKETDEFKLYFTRLKVNLNILFRILKIGLPAGLQSAVFSLSNMVIQSSVNEFGNINVAYNNGNAACQNIEGFVYTSMNGVAQGALTFTSQNMGAENYGRIRKGVIYSLICATIAGLVLGFGAIGLSDQLLLFFSLDAEGVLHAKERMWVICSIYFTCGIMDVMANSIRGMGNSLVPMVITLAGACGIRLLYLFTVFQIPEIHVYKNIFISYPLSWIITFIALTVCFILIWRRKKLKS